MQFNNVTFQRLSFWESDFKDPIKGIPESSGIYYWVYWPEFNAAKITVSQLELRLREYASKHLIFTEEIIGKYKYHVTVGEQGYPSRHNTLFGLAPSKHNKLVNYLSDASNRQFFANFFKDVCFSRPFYIGKAKNLRSRLGTQHFRSSTEVLPEIDANGIPHSDIWVGYRLIPDIANEDINNIFEEIFSRRVKPGLTKKPN